MHTCVDVSYNLPSSPGVRRTVRKQPLCVENSLWLESCAWNKINVDTWYVILTWD